MSDKNVKNTALCPTDAELISFKRGAFDDGDDLEARISEHLLLCEECFIRAEFIDFESSAEPLETEETASTQTPGWVKEASRNIAARDERSPRSMVALKEVLHAGGLKTGQIWRPKTENILISDGAGGIEKLSFMQLGSTPHLVVVTAPQVETVSGFKVTSVVPVHGNFELMREADDWVVRKESCPLNYSVLLASWLHCKMLTDNLESCFGEITDDRLISRLEDFGTRKQYADPADFSLDAALGSENHLPAQDAREREIALFRIREFRENAYLYAPVESFAQPETALRPAGFPAYVAAAYRKFRESIFSLDEILGFTPLRVGEPAMAAGGDVTIYSKMTQFPGFVRLRIGSSGTALLEARFDIPKKVEICLFDPLNNDSIAFVNEDGDSCRTLIVPSGHTRRNLTIAPRSNPAELNHLKLLILKLEA